jgi:hypothetical protein
MATYRIAIPDWRPTPDNKLSHTHWAKAKKRKDTDREMVAAYALIADAMPATGKRRVQLEISLVGRQQETDPYAYAKSLLDALVKCRMLIDDKAEFVEWVPAVYSRGTRSEAVIVLTDLPE